MAGVEGLDEEVGVLGEAPEQVPAIGGVYVEGDAPLVGSIGPPEEALLWVHLVLIEGTQLSGAAPSRRLYLDYVGP